MIFKYDKNDVELFHDRELERFKKVLGKILKVIKFF